MTLEDLTNKKRILKIAVQMDDPEYLDRHGDSTLALIEEAIKRKFIVYTYNVNDLSLIKNSPITYARKVIGINVKSNDYIKLKKKTLLVLNSCDVILVRQDPPFNMPYITATHILDKLKNTVKIINSPSSIRNAPEKLFVTDFFHLMPPTIITRDSNRIINFVKENNKSVIKPLYGNGGKDIFLLSPKDPNLNVIIEKMLSDEEHLIVQKFIKNVKNGDKRILLINGKPVGALNRVPEENEIRANLHVGASSKKIGLSKRDISICNEIGPVLKSKGLYFTGIDVIDGFLTEINVTSPTCIREIDKFNKTNISKIFWDYI